MGVILNRIDTDNDIERVANWVREKSKQGVRAGPVIVTLGRESRSNEQNAKLWPLLKDVSNLHEYAGKKRKPEEWKVLFMSAYRGNINVVEGINGEVVNLGLSTSVLNKSQFSGLIDFIYAVGAEWDIAWGQSSHDVFHQNSGGQS